MQIMCNKLEVNKPLVVRSVEHFLLHVQEFRYSDDTLTYYTFIFNDNAIMYSNVCDFRLYIARLLMIDFNFSHLAVNELKLFAFSYNSITYKCYDQFTKEFNPYYRWVINAK